MESDKVYGGIKVLSIPEFTDIEGEKLFSIIDNKTSCSSS